MYGEGGTEENPRQGSLYARLLYDKENINTIDSGAINALGVAIYEYIINNIFTKKENREVIENNNEAKMVELWINGAIKVNTGKGFNAEYIREYTKIQFEQRGLGTPDRAEVRNQVSSNEIAINVARDLLRNIQVDESGNQYLGELEPAVNSAPMVQKRKTVAGSMIGGIAETQEMLDFCGKHNITADVEMINMQDINEAFKRMLKSDVKYRFVIDMASLKE